MSNQQHKQQHKQQEQQLPSLMESMLYKLCTCGSSRDQVIEETEGHPAKTTEEQQPSKKKYGMFSNFCCASPSMLPPLPAVEGPSICRKDTMPIENTKATRALDSRRRFTAPLALTFGNDPFSDRHGDDEDGNNPRPLSGEDSCDSLIGVASFSKYPDGPPPISPTGTDATVSLSDSMSMKTENEEEEEFLGLGSTRTVLTRVVTRRLPPRPKRQKSKCPCMPNADDEDYEPYGVLLSSKPEKYSRKKGIAKSADDSQYQYSITTGGVTFQPPMFDGDDVIYSMPMYTAPELK